MDEQEMEQVVDALHRYFDRARPNDDAYNAAISQADRQRYGGQMLLLGPAVIVEGLRNMVRMQMMAHRLDSAADRELEMMGVYLLFCYRSLVKAYGVGGVGTLSTLGLLILSEDVVALVACTLGLLSEETDPMLRLPLQPAALLIKEQFEKREGTGCRLALAWAALCLGIQEPFKTFGLPTLTAILPREGRQFLERAWRLSDRESRNYIASLVLRSVLLDIASDGQALPGWRRKGD